MTQELKPCPFIFTDSGAKDHELYPKTTTSFFGTNWYCIACDCGYRSPRALSLAKATDYHNALPRLEWLPIETAPRTSPNDEIVFVDLLVKIPKSDRYVVESRCLFMPHMGSFDDPEGWDKYEIDWDVLKEDPDAEFPFSMKFRIYEHNIKAWRPHPSPTPPDVTT